MCLGAGSRAGPCARRSAACAVFGVVLHLPILTCKLLYGSHQHVVFGNAPTSATRLLGDLDSIGIS